MKKFLFLLFTTVVFILLVSCAEKDQRVSYSMDSIKGDWIVTNIDLRAENESPEVQERLTDGIGVFKERIQTTIVSFKESGLLLADELAKPIDTGKWSFEAPDKLTFGTGMKGMETISFDIVRLHADTFLLRSKIQEDVWFTFDMMSVPDNYAGNTLMSPASQAWKTKPRQRESPDEIKARVMGMLHFYAHYFYVNDKTGTPYFDTKKIILPLRYYKGGIELISAAEKPEWSEFFFDDIDAGTGFRLLETAFFSIEEYPDRESSLIEFSDFLNSAANNLSKVNIATERIDLKK